MATWLAVLGIFQPRHLFQGDVHAVSPTRHNAGMALSRAPTAPEFTIPPHVLCVLLLDRLRLPLFLTEATCEACHKPLDPLGRHRTAGPNSGRLKKRATRVERVLARICRGAGGHVKGNARLRDMNVGVSATDDRNVDVTMLSPLRRNGEARPNAAEVNGAVLLQARTAKETRYAELMTRRCRLWSWSEWRKADVGAMRQALSSGSWAARKARGPLFLRLTKLLSFGSDAGPGC